MIGCYWIVLETKYNLNFGINQLVTNSCYRPKAGNGYTFVTN